MINPATTTITQEGSTMERMLIAIDQLVINPEINPRHISNDDDVADLVAQITHNGFTDAMWVRPQESTDKFEVIDGSRRLRALHICIEQGAFQGAVACDVFHVDDAHAREMALAAHQARADLTPVDEAIAYYRLKLSGMPDETIAAHFAVPVRRVQQRIGIGSLAPIILEALRADQIDLNCAMAFTLLKTHEAQENLFTDLGGGGTRIWANHVRNAITAKALAGSNFMCKFIGEAAYEAAGGTITRDLFNTEVFFEDAQLVQRLFDEKLAETAASLKAEGWAFVDIIKPEAVRKLYEWTQLPAKGARELSEEETQALATARTDLATAMQQQDENENADEWDSDLDERIDELNALIAALSAKPYTEKQIKKSGCVIILHTNEVEIRKGMLKPTLAKKTAASDDEPDLEAERQPAQVIEAVDYTEALNQYLNEVARNATKLAMVTTKQVATYRMGLASRLLDAVDRGHEAPFQGSIKPSDNGINFGAEIGRAYELQETVSFPELIAALELLEPEQILQLEAYLAASQLQFSNLKSADVLCVLDLIDTDMKAEGFAPDAEFLTKLSRKQIELILDEINPNWPRSKGAKKTDLVAQATPLIAEHNWLPAPLRTSTYQGPGSAAWQEALAAKLVSEAEAARQTDTERQGEAA